MIAAGISPPPIEVDVRNDSATILVRTPETRGIVLLAPSGGGDPATMGAFGEETRFVVAPGEYRLFWLKDVRTLEFRNPGVLNALRGGVSVQVSAGATETVELKEMAR